MYLRWGAIIGTIIAIVAVYYYFAGTGEAKKEVFAPVKRGKFVVAVTASGELYAKNSKDIRGPQGINSIGIWQIKIANMIPEGTVVKKGDFVASLDGSEVVSKLKDRQAELDKAQSMYAQTQLDTALELRQARDELVNLRYAQEEKALVLKQSKYEPPATIRQAEIDMEKSKRAYLQASENYQVKRNKAVAKMQAVAADLSTAQNRVELIQKLLESFEINAPEGGMMIYARDWNGEKRREGSQIGTWDPVVATLPDMSVMMSRVYINEVDVRKVKAGQSVQVKLDAFPDKKLSGKVTAVANVGEQKPKSIAKVFEVNIEVAQKDTTLLPAMTTSNTIVAETLENVVYIPLDALHNEQNITFVYKRKGASGSISRQEVKVGKSNDNEIVIAEGLTTEDQVMLTKPANGDKIALTRLAKK